jgi:type I restriction enzyme, R subunit
MSPRSPEQRAREQIDAALAAAGWAVQSRDEIHLGASRGVAVREFILASGFGTADYLLFVDGRAVGALEAKKAGFPLTGVELQGEKYAQGLPATLTAPIRPLPFVYLSTGAETLFINLLDPRPRSRPVFSFHRPDTLAEWLDAEPLERWAASRGEGFAADGPGRGEGYDARPSTLRGRLRTMPPVHVPNLWRNKVEAITRLEQSLAEDRPRALIQMATGSGKTIAAITAIYRLIKYGGARRVLFLVDRSNLGEQAEKEFQGYRTPDVNRKFTELYNVQRLTSNTIMDSSKVVITTIQRLYSMLKGEPDLDPSPRGGARSSRRAGGAQGAAAGRLQRRLSRPSSSTSWSSTSATARSTPVAAGARVLRRLPVGLTATPSKQTSASSTRTSSWSTTTRAPWPTASTSTSRSTASARRSPSRAPRSRPARHDVGYRDRQTRKLRWEQPDEDLTYDAAELDRASSRRTRSAPSSARSATSCSRHLPRPHGGAQDADLRQGRQPRRGHRRDRPRGVRQGQRLLPEDHLQGHRRRRPRT